jgi:NADH:ubiquinone oxidoreductase subunit K
MDLRQLIGRFFSSFLLLGIVRRYKSRAALMKIKFVRAYVFGVKKTRTFLLGALFVLISFVFLINGLSLIQAVFFTYSSLSSGVKFFIALLLGALEFFVSIGVLIYLFREETWGKVFEIHKAVNSVVNKEDKNSKT